MWIWQKNYYKLYVYTYFLFIYPKQLNHCHILYTLHSSFQYRSDNFISLESYHWARSASLTRQTTSTSSSLQETSEYIDLQNKKHNRNTKKWTIVSCFIHFLHYSYRKTSHIVHWICTFFNILYCCSVRLFFQYSTVLFLSNPWPTNQLKVVIIHLYCFIFGVFVFIMIGQFRYDRTRSGRLLQVKIPFSLWHLQIKMEMPLTY